MIRSQSIILSQISVKKYTEAPQCKTCLLQKKLIDFANTEPELPKQIWQLKRRILIKTRKEFEVTQRFRWKCHHGSTLDLNQIEDIVKLSEKIIWNQQLTLNKWSKQRQTKLIA